MCNDTLRRLPECKHDQNGEMDLSFICEIADRAGGNIENIKPAKANKSYCVSRLVRYIRTFQRSKNT